MTIVEYKEFIVQKLKIARDCAETEQIINRSIKLFKEENMPPGSKAEYLLRLKDGLKQKTEVVFDYFFCCLHVQRRRSCAI
jgi:hypothetical protein